MLPKYTPLIRTYFWRHVHHSETCWLWIGQKNESGYGIFRIHKQRLFAHRASYELHYGAIPASLFVCHTCDTPACIRPDHLFVGTSADNMRDAAQKGRVPHGDAHWSRRAPERIARGDRNGARTQPEHCTKGVTHGMARLRPEDVQTIRHLYAAGNTTYAALGARYGIAQQHVHKIVKRLTWKHIT